MKVQYSLIYIGILLSLMVNAVQAQKRSMNSGQKDRYEKKLEDIKDNYVNEMVSDIGADDFQKEILKEKVYAYIEAKKAILKSEHKIFEKEQMFEDLDHSHFSDLKGIIPDDVVTKLKAKLKEKYNPNKKRKSKRKKRKS